MANNVHLQRDLATAAASDAAIENARLRGLLWRYVDAPTMSAKHEGEYAVIVPDDLIAEAAAAVDYLGTGQ